MADRVPPKRALIVGGDGGRTREYRDSGAEAGFEITHHERGALPDASRQSKPAVVLIILPAISHSLRRAAVLLANRAKAPICYLTSASSGAVQRALKEIGAAHDGPPGRE